MSVKEAQAQNLLDVLREHDVDRKIAEFTAVKAQVKHHSVEVESIPLLFEACRIGVVSPNNSLASHALSCLGHLIRRVTIQEPSKIRREAHHTLPLLVEKLGDQKDRNRSVAVNAIMELYKNVPADVEKAIKEAGLTSRNPRTKQESLRWLAQIHASQPGFSFRAYTPYLMQALEDASEPVRETAKEVVVELFREAPDHAKSDLKRELQKRQVRKGIAAYIVSQLGFSAVEVDLKSSVRAPEAHFDGAGSTHSGKTAAPSNAGSTASSFLSTLPGHELEPLPPAHVNTNRELEETFQDMMESFEGRESEHNWLAREKNIKKLRHLARGNAYHDFQTTFQAGIKSLLDGIMKTVNSLRTSLATTGCQLVKDLAIVMGPGLDPMLEIILSNFVKLCAGTKKITSQLGNLVVAVIMAHVSYHPKLLAHINIACNDKNVSPRTYATGWIAVLLESHLNQKGYIEHTGGVEALEKCIKRGLTDANPGVRENMRATFWKFVAIWPQRAEPIADSLEPAHRKLLDKSNPNPGTILGGGSSAKAPALGRATTAPARPSIKDAIKARKANMKAQPQLDAPRAPSPPAPAGPSGLASAPVRRPGLKPRPQTIAEHALPTDQRSVYGRAVSPVPSGRATPMRGERTVPQSPPQPRVVRGVTPSRTVSGTSTSRKLTILEQLNHADWRVRVEGVVTVACILAKRTPPGYEGQKMPSLPPSDVFAPTLGKLLNDPQPEVVEHVVAPEVLAELAKVVSMDQIVAKVLLLSEGDDEDHAHSTNTASLPALKQMMSEEVAMDLLFRIITSLGGSGIVPRKLALGTYTVTQKRKIIHGCLLWMNELIESYARGNPNEFFTDSNYKSLVNRLVGMHAAQKTPNSPLTAAILRNLRQLDVPEFDKIMATFEGQIVRDLKNAWGQNVDEDGDIVLEERVAGVEQVLGSVPQVGGSITPPSPSEHLQEEDFTLINPLSGIPLAHRPVTPPKIAARDNEKLQDLPQLPSTPTQVPDLLAEPTVKKTARIDDQQPSITVYQDPVGHSDGLIDTGAAAAQGLGDWNRHKLRKQATPSSGRTPEHSTRLLMTLIGKLETKDIDAQGLKKLAGIARENPVRGVLQEPNGEGVHDIWQGGEVFGQLLDALVMYLCTQEALGKDLANQGLLVLKQLLGKAAPYFVRHEQSVLSTLLIMRERYTAETLITSTIEEVTERYVAISEPVAGIDALLKITASGQPELKAPGWCLVLSILTELVRTCRNALLEPLLEPVGQLAVKAFDSPESDVRRSCVNLCVALYQQMNDAERLFDDILVGMKSGHQNLLAYYFKKAENSRS